MDIVNFQKVQSNSPNTSVDYGDNQTVETRKTEEEFDHLNLNTNEIRLKTEGYYTESPSFRSPSYSNFKIGLNESREKSLKRNFYSGSMKKKKNPDFDFFNPEDDVKLGSKIEEDKISHISYKFKRDFDTLEDFKNIFEEKSFFGQFEDDPTFTSNKNFEVLKFIEPISEYEGIAFIWEHGVFNYKINDLGIVNTEKIYKGN